MSAATMVREVVFGGAAVATWGAVYPGAQIFGPSLRTTGDLNAIALTFDDGPNPAATPALLELLERNRAKASFFVMGAHVRAFPQIAREIALRGHTIGNHTETHPNVTFLSAKILHDELIRCDEAIHLATGLPTRWMRPPFGFRGPQLDGVVRRMGYAGVAMWSRWMWDWKPQPAQNVIRRLRRAGGGDIVLLHDGDHRNPRGERQHTVKALEYWLPRWKNAGLRFVTVDEVESVLNPPDAATAITEKAS
ncbi:MAG TPA: polysaccharide deacetylase family protein [Candidatus Acidoferrales bacterium]|nr:polysaccharide deacetylase family protein [Candidatus Acidoferrales bacterium]